MVDVFAGIFRDVDEENLVEMKGDVDVNSSVCFLSFPIIVLGSLGVVVVSDPVLIVLTCGKVPTERMCVFLDTPVPLKAVNEVE